MATVRLFIAIEIPPDIRSGIGAVIQELQAANADVRWEQTDKLHITLKFLGGTDEGMVSKIFTSLDTLCRKTPVFTLRYRLLGCFPPKREPRIIWIGVEENSCVLQRLSYLIDESMSSFGFKKEEREFHAHVTVGRVKSQRNIRDLLRTMESITFESQPTTISELALVKSELKPSGSVYTILHRIPLHHH
ncbi:MAG: RNA 2',3'-cyclic phosphodiesterase [Bacteroidetes bacterium]|nr:RNA 2',3'-cyclic phosphodiesterase [Bacteroidota bacterium]MCW5894371.1 RNA 2',3'-cyclic phosphodiesterase [Bacteroidota bacterium]